MPKQQTEIPQLNQFQKDTQRKLRALVEQKGSTANFETVAYHYGSMYPLKTQEVGIKVKIGDYETWIHPDGADVSRGADKRFEIYDYASLDDLQGAYLKFVGELLRGSSKPKPQANASIEQDEPDFTPRDITFNRIIYFIISLLFFGSAGMALFMPTNGRPLYGVAAGFVLLGCGGLWLVFRVLRPKTAPMKRALSDNEKSLISSIAAMLPDEARRQTLLDDMANATAEVFATEGAVRIVFCISGYDRPPYRGQHSFGVEGKVNDRDGQLLMIGLFADQNDRLLELEIVRCAHGPIKGPNWQSLALN